MSHRSIYIFFLCVLAAALLLAAGCAELDGASQPTQSAPVTTGQDTSTTTSSVAPAALSVDGWLLGIPLPTTVSQVIDKLGEPDSFELPDLEGDPSPWGQWFRWSVGDNDFTYSVLNDDYSGENPGYDANVSVSVLQRDADVVSPALMDGMMLGLTIRSEVEASFGSAVQPSGLAGSWPFAGVDTYVSSLVREQGGIFTFYLFDPDDLLVGIAQATFDLGMAD